MGCESCSSGKGGTPAGCKSNGTCSSGGCSKLAVFDWLSNMEMPGQIAPFEFVEIRFKSNRKEFFRNGTSLSLNPGDAVVVEANPGHDLGTVSAAGELARLQMERKNALKNTRDLRKITRRATSEDLSRWREARGMEEDTMHKARSIATLLRLDMKISDVEYQGDKTKAIFYYTAEGRVDFRELIKRFADTFRVRVEMKQIGARQEAGRLGGIGSCGRELCCSTWLTDFRSVSTSAARYQQLALNTQKLAGQCGKLKCCLNYELDSYMDALKHYPKHYNKLKTKKGVAFHLKTDIFKGLAWFIYDESATNTPIPVGVERVKAILEMNEKEIFPDDLLEYSAPVKSAPVAYSNVVGQDSLTRFDNTGKKKKKKRKKPSNPQAGDGEQRQANSPPTRLEGQNRPRPNKPKGERSEQKPQSAQLSGNDAAPGNDVPNKSRNNRNRNRNKGGGAPKPTNPEA